jgi:hypothetical protein
MEKELHQRNYIPMIVKIYGERGKNKKSWGRRGLTLTRIIFCNNKKFRGTYQKGKERGRTG